MEQERLTGGDFTVSVRVSFPLGKAARTDNVDDTLNYATLYEIINKEMQKPSCLLENVAGRIGGSIFAAFPGVDALTVKVTKLNPPTGGDMDGASIELNLERSPEDR